MKATVDKITNRYEIIGLDKAKKQIGNKPTYEMRYLHTFECKTYKTIDNAVKALIKAGFEYVPIEDINIVCNYD